MNRYKPVGWRYESHKHYLAAKGIKTRYDAKKYFADQPQLMEDERPFYKEHKLKSEGMNLRMHDIGKMHDKVMQQLDEAVQKGELDPHKREEFFTGDFKRAKEDYLNKTYNTSQFNDEVERSLVYFLKVNGKNLHVFFWADKKNKESDNKESDQNREYLSGSHVGSGTI